MNNQNNTPPPWSEAPPWANYICQQPEGDWYAFSHKPIETSYGFSYGVGWVGKHCLPSSLCFKKDTPNRNWRSTLEKRPDDE